MAALCTAVIAPDSNLACEVTPTSVVKVVSAGALRPRSPAGFPVAFKEKAFASSPRRLLELEGPEPPVLLFGEQDAGAPVIQLPLMHVPARGWLVDARNARDRGALDEAAAALSTHESAADLHERALALGLRGRVELARGNVALARDRLKASSELHRQLGRLSDAVDDAFALAFLLVQRSHGYAEARSVLDAVAPLAERLPEGRARLPYYRAVLDGELDDHRAALERYEAASREALPLGLTRLYRNAESARALELQRLGRYQEARVIFQAISAAGERAANASADGARVGETPSDAPTVCERAEWAINEGYGSLREGALGAHDQADAALTNATARLNHAVELTSKGGCTDPHLAGLALANLAWTQYRAGNIAAAGAALASARRANASPRGTEEVSWLELEGLLVLEGPTPNGVRTALATFERERAIAREGALREGEWSSLVAMATALEKAKRFDEAMARLEEAEDLLDDLALLVPLGSGRENVLRDHGDSAARLIDLRLEHRSPTGGAAPRMALDVARRARVRVLSSVQRALRAERLGPEARQVRDRAFEAYRQARDEAERDRASDWSRARDTLSQAQALRASQRSNANGAVDAALSRLGTKREATLPALDVGALTVYVHYAHESVRLFVVSPCEEDAHGCNRREGETVVHRMGRSLSEEALRSALGGALEPMVTAERRIRVLAPPRDFDLETVVVRGRPLGEIASIEYSLDLSGNGERGARAVSSTALVVGDPLGDLPEAGKEAAAVVKRLQSAGTSEPISLLAGSDATLPRLVSELERAAFFHYAGHAVFAGHEGWDSHFRLAGDGRLSVADVLTLSQVPKRVVLSSCEAAHASSDDVASGFGIAQAFVVAGSDWVVAPVRPVGDAAIAPLAIEIASELARSDGDAGASQDGGGALKAARARVPVALLPSDRWAFRLIRP